MTTPSQNSINYKVVAYGLFVAVIGLVVWIFTSTVAAQSSRDDKQDAAIETMRDNVNELSKANLLLTKIVNEDHEELKALRPGANQSTKR